MFSVCVASPKRVGLSCESDKNVHESDKNTLFLGVTDHNSGLTFILKFILAMETQRKTENIDDIYFRTVSLFLCSLFFFVCLR